MATMEWTGPGPRRASVRTRSSRLSNQHDIQDYPNASFSRPRDHTRTLSNATALTSRASRTSNTRRSGRRGHVRKSLMGPQVEELTIERRAEMLADAAGDCLIKLVGAGLRGQARARRRRPDWQRAWEGLQTLRRSYIYTETSPPFPLLPDILDELDPHVRKQLDLASLDRAVYLCNLANFVYAIFRPDDAGDLLIAVDDDDDEMDPTPTRSAKGNKGARDVEKAEMKKISRRNAIMFRAWKMFWLLVVPKEQRVNELPLQLWLDFATQVYLTHRCPSLDPPSLPSSTVPPPPDSRLDSLFSPSAVARFGQWDVSEGWEESEDAEIGGMEKEIVERRWRLAALQRQTELESTRLNLLARRNPYDVFRHEMLAYIESDILGTVVQVPVVDNAIEDEQTTGSESEAVDLFPQADKRDRFSGRRDSRRPADNDPQGSSSENDNFAPRILGFPNEDEDLEAAESSLDEGIDDENEARGEPLELDIFEQIAIELEADERSASVTPRQHRTSQPVSTARKRRHAPEIVEEEMQWQVRDGPTPTRLVGAQATNPKFNFATKQVDAIQVDWESQSPAPTLLRSPTPIRTSLTPRPVPPPNVRSRLKRPTEFVNRVSMPPPALRVPIDIANLRRSSIPSVRRSLPVALHEDAEEQLEDIEELHDAFENILPDTQQLQGDLGDSPDGPRTPQDVDLAEMLPGSSQLLGDQDSDGGDVGNLGLVVGEVMVVDEQVDPADEPAHPFKPPTSQHLMGSSRPRPSGDALEFSQPEAEEDEEDRLLLQTREALSSSPLLSVKSSPRPSHISVPPPDPTNDPFLFNADGSSLEIDESYQVPRNHVARRSRIHGQIEGQSTSYSRISGKRKWTKAEELLLYRTVQKVPLLVQYPLRVVWYLHGEHGVLSHDLEQFNPQHMKDKMRLIVNTRSNNRRPILGRARYFFPGSHPDRKAFDEEMEELRARAVSRVESDSEAEEDDGEEEEGDGEGEDEGGGEDERALMDSESEAEAQVDEEVDELESEEDDRVPLPSTRTRARPHRGHVAPIKNSGTTTSKNVLRVNEYGESSARAERAQQRLRKSKGDVKANNKANASENRNTNSKTKPIPATRYKGKIPKNPGEQEKSGGSKRPILVVEISTRASRRQGRNARPSRLSKPTRQMARRTGKLTEKTADGGTGDDEIDQDSVGGGGVDKDDDDEGQDVEDEIIDDEAAAAEELERVRRELVRQKVLGLA